MATVANRKSVRRRPSPENKRFPDAPEAWESDFNLDDLLHPALGFEHPLDVVKDCDLTRAEKRAILASWASDLRAIEAAPALRLGPRGRPVRFDDIVDALRKLDRTPHTPAGDLPARQPGLFTRRAAKSSVAHQQTGAGEGSA